jgi:hypothetical protein
MRLTAEQTEVIRTAVREVYGEDSRLWLFGSKEIFSIMRINVYTLIDG